MNYTIIIFTEEIQYLLCSYRHVIYLNDIPRVLGHFHYFVKTLRLFSLIYKFLVLTLFDKS